MTIAYLAPRKRKLRSSPAKWGEALNLVDQHQGARALAASVIGDALHDYLTGNAQASDQARLFFMSESYDFYRSALGLPDDAMPPAIRDRVIMLGD